MGPRSADKPVYSAAYIGAFLNAKARGPQHLGKLGITTSEQAQWIEQDDLPSPA